MNHYKLFPSQTVLALVRAFDLVTPPAATKEEFRCQSQLFIDSVIPYVDTVASLLEGCDMHRQSTQNRFDALLSVAYDVGIDVLMESALPELLSRRPSKSAVTAAFMSLPAYEEVLRDELVGQLALYKLPLLPRRRFEVELFYGNIYFAIGPTLDTAGNRVYAASVLHPLYRFFYAVAGK